MKNAKETTQLLDSLIACGDNLSRIGNLIKDLISENTEVSQQSTNSHPAKEIKTSDKAETQVFSFIDVRKAFSAKSHAGFTSQVKELIKQYGASKLSDT